MLHGCAMISERSGDPFVLPDENKCDRAHSFGSDKSANNADGNYVAVVQEKIYILIYRKKKLFFTRDIYKTIARGVSHLKHLSISIMIKYVMFHHNLFIIHHNLLCTHTIMYLASARINSLFHQWNILHNYKTLYMPRNCQNIIEIILNISMLS